MYHVCVWCLWRPEEGLGSPGIGCEPPCECWLLNPGPMQEQLVFSPLWWRQIIFPERVLSSPIHRGFLWHLLRVRHCSLFTFLHSATSAFQSTVLLVSPPIQQTWMRSCFSPSMSSKAVYIGLQRGTKCVASSQLSPPATPTLYGFNLLVSELQLKERETSNDPGNERKVTEILEALSLVLSPETTRIIL